MKKLLVCLALVVVASVASFGMIESSADRVVVFYSPQHDASVRVAVNKDELPTIGPGYELHLVDPNTRQLKRVGTVVNRMGFYEVTTRKCSFDNVRFWETCFHEYVSGVWVVDVESPEFFPEKE